MLARSSGTRRAGVGKQRLGIAALLVLQAALFFAHAGNKKLIQQQTELSMLVKGAIDIRADGSVDHYSIENSEKILPGIASLIGRQVPRWKFEQVLADGKATSTHTSVVWMIVAKPNVKGDYTIHIQSAGFSGAGGAAKSRISVRERKPPVLYPASALRMGMSGDVYLVLKIGPDGKVIDAIVQKVNLTASANDTQMAKARKAFGETALEAVRNWTFNVPTQGKHANQPYWSGMLPIVYSFDPSDSVQHYGEWRPFLRVLAPKLHGRLWRTNQAKAAVARVAQRACLPSKTMARSC